MTIRHKEPRTRLICTTWPRDDEFKHFCVRVKSRTHAAGITSSSNYTPCHAGVTKYMSVRIST